MKGNLYQHIKIRHAYDFSLSSQVKSIYLANKKKKSLQYQIEKK
jgi:hypothetical protein